MKERMIKGNPIPRSFRPQSSYRSPSIGTPEIARPNKIKPWVLTTIRHRFGHFVGLITALLSTITVHLFASEPARPNILMVVSDDQSWPHCSIYGTTQVKTPTFDRIAREGGLFTHAFCPASQCSPSRAALLTGRNIWQMREAGTQASLFPAELVGYQDLLAAAGYHVGYTGKPWAPGNWRVTGRSQNPAGRAYNTRKLNPPTSEISDIDYAANFADFINERPSDAPFSFWFGCYEPHRNFDQGSASRADRDPTQIQVPPYLPNQPSIRGDLMDYFLEIEWFDQQLEKFLAILEQAGELSNTLILVTSDNGMPFPRAKATLYESGTRVPLAIRWPARIRGGRTFNGLTSLIDLAPTVLAAAGLQPAKAMTGISLWPSLTMDRPNPTPPHREYVLLGKERHNHARADNIGYPERAIRTKRYLYIQNLKPDRWPMGDPPHFRCHTKMKNPTKDYILQHQTRSAVEPIYQKSYAKRPGEELFDIINDPFCLNNLAGSEAMASTQQKLKSQLTQRLIDQKDPRVLGYGDIFDSYPFYGKIQSDLPGFKESGQYNPAFWPFQEQPIPTPGSIP